MNAAIQCPHSESCRRYYSLSAYLLHLNTAHYADAYLAAPSSSQSCVITTLNNRNHNHESVLASSQSLQPVESVIELFCTTPSADNLIGNNKILVQLKIGEMVFCGTSEALQNDIDKIEEAIAKCPVFSRKEHQSIVEKTSKICTADDIQKNKTLITNIQQFIRWHIYHLTEIPSTLQQAKTYATLTSINYTSHLSHLFINFICQLPSLRVLIIDNNTFHLSTSTILQLQNSNVNLRELYILDCHFDIDLSMLRELRTLWLPTLTTFVIDFSVLSKAFSKTYTSMLSTLAFMYLSDFIGHDYLSYGTTATVSGKRQGRQGGIFSKKQNNTGPKEKEDKKYKPFVLQKIERSSILLKSVSEKSKVSSGAKTLAVPVPIAYVSRNHSFSHDNSSNASECSCGNDSFDIIEAPNMTADINLSATNPLMILNSYHSRVCQRYGTTLGLIHYPISSDLPFLGAWGDEPFGFFGIVFDGVLHDISSVALKIIEGTAIESLIPLSVFKNSKVFDVSLQGENGKSKRKEKRTRQDKGQDNNQPAKQSLTYLFYRPYSTLPITMTFADFCKSFTPECLNIELLLSICRYDISLEHVRTLTLNLSETLSSRRHVIDYVVKSLALRSNAEVEQILEHRTGLSFLTCKDEFSTKDSGTLFSPACNEAEDPLDYDKNIAFFIDMVVTLLPYLYRLKEIKLGPRSSTMTLLLPPYNGHIYVSLLRLILIASRRLISIHPAINYILPIFAGVERFRVIDAFYYHVKSIYEMIRGEYFNTHYHTYTSLMEDGKKLGDLEMASLIEDGHSCAESPGGNLGNLNSLCSIAIMAPGGKDFVYGNEVDDIHISKPFRPFKYAVSSFDFQYAVETTLAPVHPQQLVDLYGYSGGGLKTIDLPADETYIFSQLHRLLQSASQSNFCFLDLLPLCPPRTIVYCLELIREGSGSFSCSSFNAVETLSIPCSKFFLTDNVVDPAVVMLNNLQETIGYRRSGADNRSDSTYYKQNCYYSLVKYKCMLDKSVYSQSLMAQRRFVRYERRIRQQYKPSVMTLSKHVVLNNSYVHFFFSITPDRIENLYMGLRNFNSNRKTNIEPGDSYTIDVPAYIAEITDRFVLNYNDIDLLSSMCISSPLLADDIKKGCAPDADADTEKSSNNDHVDNLLEKDVTDSISRSPGAPFTPDEIKSTAQPSSNLLPPRQPSSSTKPSLKTAEMINNKNNPTEEICVCTDNQSHYRTNNKNTSCQVTMRLISLILLNIDGLLYSDINLINRAISVKLLKLLSKDLDLPIPMFNSTLSDNNKTSIPSRSTSISVFNRYLNECPPHSMQIATIIERFISMLFTIPALHTDSTILNMISMQKNALFSLESFQMKRPIASTRGNENSDSENQLITELSSISWRVPRLGLQFAPNLKGTRFSIDSSAVGTLSEVKSQVTNITACTYTNSIITIIRRRDAPELDVDDSAHIVFKEQAASKLHTLDIPSIDGLSIITALHNDEDAYTSTMESPCAQQALGESLIDAGGTLIDKEPGLLQDPSVEFPTALHEDSPCQVTPNLRSYVTSQRPVALLTICKPILYYYMIFKMLVGDKRANCESLSPAKEQKDKILVDSPGYSLYRLVVLPIGGTSFKPNHYSIYAICKSVATTPNSSRLPSQTDLNMSSMPKRLSTTYLSPRNIENLSEHSNNNADIQQSDSTDEIIASIYFAYQLLHTIYKQELGSSAHYSGCKKPKTALIYGSGKLFKCVDTTISAKLLALLLMLLTTGVLSDVIIDSDILLRYFPTSMAYNAFILNGSMVSKLYKNGSLVLGWDNVREGVDIPFSLYLQLFQEISAIQLSLDSIRPLTYLDLSGTLTDVQSHSIYNYYNYSETQFNDFLKNMIILDQKIGFRTLILPTKVLSLSELRMIYRLADIISTALSCTRLHNVVFSNVCSIFKLVDDGPEVNAELPPTHFNSRLQIKSLFTLKQNKGSTLHIYNKNWKDVLSFLIHVGEKCKALFTRVCTLDFTPPEDDENREAISALELSLFDQTVTPLVLQLISLCVGVDRLVIPSRLVAKERSSNILAVNKWIGKAYETQKLQEVVLNPPDEDIACKLKQSFNHLCIS